MEAGKSLSPIVAAIGECETKTTGEIRVHLSRRLWDSHAEVRARKIFQRLQMFRTTHRNAILLYVNLRKRTFAIHADQGFYERVNQTIGAHYWSQIAEALKQDLLATHYERAIARAVNRVGTILAKEFPADLDRSAADQNELSNEISTD